MSESTKSTSRAPVSQQAHKVEKTDTTGTIGGNVTIEINEKKNFCSHWYNNS